MIQSFFAKKLAPLITIPILAILFLGRRKQFELGLLDDAFYACYIRPMGDTILASLPRSTYCNPRDLRRPIPIYPGPRKQNLPATEQL